MKLTPGQSNRDDVIRAHGKPAMEWKGPEGSVTLEFPKGPAGYTTWMVTIGPDNIVRSLEQVLDEAHFAQVTAGRTKGDVRRLLGKPGRTQEFPLKEEEVWSWRYLEVPNQAMHFHAHFSKDGVVTTTSRTRDDGSS